MPYQPEAGYGASGYGGSYPFDLGGSSGYGARIEWERSVFAPERGGTVHGHSQTTDPRWRSRGKANPATSAGDPSRSVRPGSPRIRAVRSRTARFGEVRPGQYDRDPTRVISPRRNRMIVASLRDNGQPASGGCPASFQPLGASVGGCLNNPMRSALPSTCPCTASISFLRVSNASPVAGMSSVMSSARSSNM